MRFLGHLDTAFLRVSHAAFAAADRLLAAFVAPDAFVLTVNWSFAPTFAFTLGFPKIKSGSTGSPQPDSDKTRNSGADPFFQEDRTTDFAW